MRRQILLLAALLSTAAFAQKSGVPLHRSNFSQQKHGAVTHLTVKEANALEKYWKK